MINLKDLVNKGEEIKASIKYVPPVTGVIRTYSVHKMEDHSIYSTWKNKVFLYLQNILKDEDALKRFEEQDELFENKCFDPKYLDNMLGILKAYLDSGIEGNQIMTNEIATPSDKVFIVHGHNEAANLEVARTIERLGLKSIILREQPNSGQTIIEKFEKYAYEANFAVILLTADDKIGDNQNYRARQNVIFEMGYFMGKLGRSHVMCLLQNGVEKPGDIDGIVYTPLDSSGAWKFSIVKELKNTGYKVDANKVL